MEKSNKNGINNSHNIKIKITKNRKKIKVKNTINNSNNKNRITIETTKPAKISAIHKIKSTKTKQSSPLNIISMNQGISLDKISKFMQVLE